MKGKLLKFSTASLAAALCYSALLLAPAYSEPTSAGDAVTKLKAQAESVKTPRMDGEDWQRKHKLLVQKAAKTKSELQFFGDSITELIEWHQYHNLKAFKQWYGQYDPQLFGISGDTSGELLWRVNNGEVGGDPRLAVVLIGTNDLVQFVPIPPEKTIENIGLIVKTIRTLKPNCKVLVMAIFPRGASNDPKKTYYDEHIAIINKGISSLDNGDTIRYLDISEDFLTPKKAVNADLMPDFLHPNYSGYEIWSKGIKATVEQMMEPSSKKH